MALRSIWKGSLSFGLVNVQVKLYSATEDTATHLKTLHRDCLSPIRQVNVCTQCKTEAGLPVEVSKALGNEAKGYPVESGFCIVEESDLASLPLKTVNNIEVLGFGDTASFDPRMVEKSYFLGPDTGDAKHPISPRSYALVMASMLKVGKAALVKLCYRGKEHLAIVRPFKGVMLLQTLVWTEELRDVPEVSLPTVTEKEIELGTMLMAQFATPELTAFKDEYNDALIRLIAAKTAGQPIIAPVAAPAQLAAPDLADLLIKSLNMKGGTTDAQSGTHAGESSPAAVQQPEPPDGTQMERRPAPRAKARK